MGRDRPAALAEYNGVRKRVAVAQHLDLSGERDLGGAEVAGVFPAGEALDHLAGDTHFVTHGNGDVTTADEDQQAVGGRVVAVAIGVLNEELVAVHGGHDAAGHDGLPFEGGAVTLALNVVDRHLGRDVEGGGGAADFVGNHKHRPARRAVVGRNEGQDLGTEITGGARLGIAREIARRDVLHEARLRRVGDVVDHDAADPLQTDEGIGLTADLADRNTLRLGTLGVGARVEAVVVVVGGVEGLRRQNAVGDQLGDLLLEGVAAVENQIALVVPDAERAAAVGNQLIDQTVAVGVAVDSRDFQPAKLLVRGQRQQRRIEQAVFGEIADARILVARVAFVRRDVVKLPVTGLVGGHGVGHEEALHRLGLDVDGAVAVAGVQTVAWLAVVLGAQRMQVDQLLGLDVDHGDRISFLQRHEGRGAVRRDRNVLRLDVARGLLAGEDAQTQVAQRVFAEEVQDLEADRVDLAGIRTCRKVDDADRAARVDALIRFAFVGHEKLRAVRREGQHVRQRTDLVGRNLGQRRVPAAVRADAQQGNRPRICHRVGFHGYGHEITEHGDRIDTRAEGLQAERRLKTGSACSVEPEDIEAVRLGVGDKEALSQRVVRDALRCTFVENPGGIGTNRPQVDHELSLAIFSRFTEPLAKAKQYRRQHQIDAPQYSAHTNYLSAPCPVAPTSFPWELLPGSDDNPVTGG